MYLWTKKIDEFPKLLKNNGFFFIILKKIIRLDMKPFATEYLICVAILWFFVSKIKIY